MPLTPRGAGSILRRWGSCWKREYFQPYFNYNVLKDEVHTCIVSYLVTAGAQCRCYKWQLIFHNDIEAKDEFETSQLDNTFHHLHLSTFLQLTMCFCP